RAGLVHTGVRAVHHRPRAAAPAGRAVPDVDRPAAGRPVRRGARDRLDAAAHPCGAGPGTGHAAGGRGGGARRAALTRAGACATTVERARATPRIGDNGLPSAVPEFAMQTIGLIGGMSWESTLPYY